MSPHALAFDPDCRNCPRLAGFLQQVAQANPGYHCRPVPPFGPANARLLVVGLAPGMHGANATGRPFTGDHAGILLYRTLHRFGFASKPESRHAGDGLELRDCRITNAVKCLPPGNQPTAQEVGNCNVYLERELTAWPAPRVILALGVVAHRALLRALGQRQNGARFGHGAVHRFGRGPWLVDSYHCSRYNTQTGRLTEDMFRRVFATARRLLTETADG